MVKWLFYSKIWNKKVIKYFRYKCFVTSYYLYVLGMYCFITKFNMRIFSKYDTLVKSVSAIGILRWLKFRISKKYQFRQKTIWKIRNIKVNALVSPLDRLLSNFCSVTCSVCLSVLFLILVPFCLELWNFCWLLLRGKFILWLVS